MISKEVISNIDFSPLLEEILEQGKTIQISLSGMSMFPFLRHGDIVQIETVDVEKLKIGDVIVFKTEDKWVAHRLIKRNIKQNLFYTRGDGKTVKDIPITPEQIKGVVTKIVKSRWKLAHFAVGKCGKIIACCSPIVAMLINWGIRIFYRKII